MDDNLTTLEARLASLLARRESRSQLRRLTTVSPGMVDFSSNSYLSLSNHPDVQRAYLSLLSSHINSISPASSPPILGSGGSRLLDGNSSFSESLERDIASFHGAPAGLLFNSGFDANVGLFSCVPQPTDVIVYDELIHASVHDGMKLSRAAQRLPFRHNAVSTKGNRMGKNLRSLDALLRDLTTGSSGREFLDGKRNVFVAVEGVYSMDGDVAPLQEIVECVERWLPKGNGYIIVDEAHSTGIYGAQGRGLVCQLGLENRVFARVHTFGKAMGCSGAIVLSSHTTRAYLINYARPLIYTTAMALPSLASIKVTYNFLMNGGQEPLIRNLHGLMQQTHNLLQSICAHYNPPADLLRLDPNPPKSPIIPLFTAHPRSLAQHCQRAGFMVRPIVAPTVPEGSERVRICLHAGNTATEVEALLRGVEEWLRSRMPTEIQEAAVDLAISQRSEAVDDILAEAGKAKL
ncbi:pyridoxal phosphate-dependent transferase [Dactylonectria estremocensis]|uniref:Pyridoxal phosphate-dependent transferase n=1 Tax=Dactylonectria estremocensis TaxID=1079267 RepID=A0A9P9EM29_9HYPO|nr:pyridoxal phosphate-dependent transferase [Dactylonectria estremocensis]